MSHHLTVCAELWLQLSGFIFPALPSAEPVLLAPGDGLRFTLKITWQSQRLSANATA